ncbi:AAA family ATPase [Streptomyces sp. MS19]|uniref:AAA family ATPase n=1 Tax=Streptomyces sp. MS19 TaxID=3385972 RepID=UPI0039A1750A
MQIDGFLGFVGERAVELEFPRRRNGYAGWTVLAGRNGSGKTSLLRCMALLLAGHRVVPALAPDYATWALPARTVAGMQAEFFMDAADLKQLRVPDPPRHPGVHARTALRIPPPETLKRSGTSVRFQLSPRWSQVLSEGGAVGGEVEELRMDEEIFPASFAAGYGPFRRLSSEFPDPLSTHATLRDPSDLAESAGRFSTLFQEDASLGESVSWIVGTYLRSLEKRAGATRLLETVLELLSDGLLPDGYEIAKVDSDGLWVRHCGLSFPLKRMSDGYRTVTALVLDIVRHLHDFHGALRARRSRSGIAVHVPGVVLIDEIDAHLHVSWQQRIGEWLKQHFPKVQFIVTTHSPYICQSADPGGLIRLPGPGEARGPEVVSEATYRRVVYGSGDDAALSDLFGLDSPYSRQADEARRQLIDLEEKVFSAAATEAEVRRYHELSERLTSTLEARVDEVSGRLGRKS